MQIFKTSFFQGIFFILICLNVDDLKRSKQNIVLEYKVHGNDAGYKASKEEQKEIKNYCKGKGVSLITKEESINELKRKQAEIFQPLFQPGGNLEDKQQKAKKQIVSITEIARYTTLTFYVNTANLPDSTKISVVSFPANEINRVKFTKTIAHTPGTLFLNCVKEAVDTCLAHKYFD